MIVLSERQRVWYSCGRTLCWRAGTGRTVVGSASCQFEGVREGPQGRTVPKRLDRRFWRRGFRAGQEAISSQRPAGSFRAREEVFTRKTERSTYAEEEARPGRGHAEAEGARRVVAAGMLPSPRR